MKEILPDYIYEYSYKRSNGPLIDSIDSMNNGINCQLLVHIILDELGLPLPKWLLSEELFTRGDYTTKIQGRYTIGDIFFFCPSPKTPFHLLHMAVVVGKANKTPMLIHIRNELSRQGKTMTAVSVDSLPVILSQKKHKILRGVRRPIHCIPYTKHDHSKTPDWFQFKE